MSLIILTPKGNIGGISIDVTVRERYTDSLEVTEQPVELGAAISDHSYKRPAQIELHCGWSNASANALISSVTSLFLGSAVSASPIPNGQMSVSDYVSQVYSQLLALQQSRNLFSVTTSLRTYSNMLITDIEVERDKKTSQVLMCVANCQELIVVSAISTTLPPQANQASPQATAETLDLGANAVSAAVPSPGGSLPSSSWYAPLL